MFRCLSKKLGPGPAGVSSFARPLQNRVIVGSLAQRAKSLEQLVRGLPGDAWTGIGDLNRGCQFEPAVPFN